MNELLDELKSRQARAVISLMTILLQTSPKELLLPKLSVKNTPSLRQGNSARHGCCNRKMKTRDNGMLDIDATIFCEKKPTSVLLSAKRLNAQENQHICPSGYRKIFDCRVFLQTWVKVKEDWRNRAQILQNFGYDEKNFD